MSIDLRTRSDGPRTPVPAGDFFAGLPALLAAHADAITPALDWLDPAPLVVEVDGASWTLDWADDRIEVREGDRSSVPRVRLSAEQLDDLVADQRTFVGLHAGGQLDQPAGTLADLNDWWLVLRAALDDRPIYTPGSVTFRSPDGAPLDLHRAFRPDDDRDAMRHFLAEAGFLRIVGLFDAAEMAAISADMDRAAPAYAPGDGRSWWAKTARGEQRLVRMQGFDRRSGATAALLDDLRFRALADIAGDGHGCDERSAANRIEALFKPIGVVEGISDVPWHKDCGLGRHSYDCCGLTVGISVTGADALSGQLRVIAGSHRALIWPARLRAGVDLPQIDLPTESGDVTLHASCTMHMAQPPVERERRVMYTSFALPPRSADADAARARLRAVREAAPVTVSQPPSPVR
jgi:Phytanoyl-CoA dioxygenase (PhyH)